MFLESDGSQKGRIGVTFSEKTPVQIAIINESKMCVCV
jgi:hypothetical protein